MKYEVEEQYSEHLKLIHLFGQSEINMKGAQWRGKSSPTIFWKSGKSVMILGKNTLIVSIYEFYFLFQMQF